jgi:hypothetical protein
MEDELPQPLYQYYAIIKIYFELHNRKKETRLCKWSNTWREGEDEVRLSSGGVDLALKLRVSHRGSKPTGMV